MPKGDVHNHLHLGGSIKSLNDKYTTANFVLPQNYNGLDGLIDFIENKVNSIMQTEEDVIYFMEMSLKNSIKDNVRYLEASVDIDLVRFFDYSIEKFIEEIDKLKQKYKSKIDFRPDIGINKHYKLENLYLNALICINSGVFSGIDIYGKEDKSDVSRFKSLFEFARQKKLKTKAHIGEFSPCDTIEETIKLLQPDEIQHGIKAADSKKTMDMILQNKIQLNICPIGNIYMGSVKCLKEHPIRKLYDHGIKITINTDDALLFNCSLTDQYTDLWKQNIFSFEEIDTIRKNSFN